MSRKPRQITNFFTTGDYDATTIDAELKSLPVGDVAGNVRKDFTWEAANVWCDLDSGRNAIHVAAGMTVSVSKNARYVVNFTANLLGRDAQIVYKFDAFNDADDYLFTFVAQRQSLSTERFTAEAVQTPPRARGLIDQIRGISDLNEISYLVRRGAGKTRD